MATQWGLDYEDAAAHDFLPTRDNMDATMQRSTGSMGSTVYRWKFRAEQLPAVMAHDWDLVGRRVFIDPEEEVVMLMAPSGPHAHITREVDELVRTAAELLGLPYFVVGDTSWFPPDVEGRMVEPDNGYYLGDVAERAEALATRPELDAFVSEEPPQLVVEVERTHGDRKKPAFYRSLGVCEMWRMDARGPRGLTVEILDLLGADGFQRVEQSLFFPLLDSGAIESCCDQPFGFKRANVIDLLRKAGMVPSRPPPEELGIDRIAPEGLLRVFKAQFAAWSAWPEDPLADRTWEKLDAIARRGVTTDRREAFEADPDYRAFDDHPVTRERREAFREAELKLLSRGGRT